MLKFIGFQRVGHLLLLSAALLFASAISGSRPATETGRRIPILLYHRFGPVAPDGMTVTTAVFASQLRLIRAGGYTVIPLSQLVAYLQGQAPAPPSRAVVITVDDGHRSIYTDMAPLVKSYGLPVTLFIYPSAISNARWAMTWTELQQLQATGLFDIQSHTYWHPNFRHERKRLAPEAYEQFVDWQLERSRDVLQQKLRRRVDMLAWPFGIYDEWLMSEAQHCGYSAVFTMERRAASGADRMMALPRFLVTDSDRGPAFERLLASGSRR
jgi:peptidoglycan/xylan/chitin deacetylase (PgdA/CDA1 family)